MQTNILIESINYNRQSSFWYCEEDVVAYFSKNDRHIKVEVVGEIIVDFQKEDAPNGGYLKDAQAVDYALTQEFTDKDLDKLGEDELIYYSNWFEFLCKKGENNEWEEVEGSVYSTVTEFMEEAKKILNDDEFWEQF